MLGYVQIDKGELKVREYEIYTGYYCGICKSIGKRYGQLPRMVLSYDAAFLAVLLASLDNENDIPLPEHCIGHHIKKKTIIRNGAIDYAADVMLILAWYKLLDDINDEGRHYAKAVKILLKKLHKKLFAKYPRLCIDIEQNLSELSRLETEKCGSLDMAAEPTARIMDIIFTEGIRQLYGNRSDFFNRRMHSVPNGSGESSGCHDSGGGCPETLSIDDFSMAPASTSETLSKIGYHMGKWIYLMDAIDDVKENIASGAYNPLIYRFDYDNSSETPEEFRKRIEAPLKFNLYHYLASIGNYVNSLDIRKNQGIIENIIYFGLNRKTEEILKGDLNESV